MATPATPSRYASKEIARRSGRLTHYDVLQIAQQAEEAVVTAAYRALARANHPDHNSGLDAAERMRELNDAYAVLSNPRQRAVYDLSLNQDRTIPLIEPAEKARVHRRSACWRCQEPLNGTSGRYCGECRWTICASCRGCGCQNPSWREKRQAPPERPWTWRSLSGWVAAAITAVGWFATLLIRHA